MLFSFFIKVKSKKRSKISVNIPASYIMYLSDFCRFLLQYVPGGGRGGGRGGLEKGGGLERGG